MRLASVSLAWLPPIPETLGPGRPPLRRCAGRLQVTAYYHRRRAQRPLAAFMTRVRAVLYRGCDNRATARRRWSLLFSAYAQKLCGCGPGLPHPPMLALNFLPSESRLHTRFIGRGCRRKTRQRSAARRILDMEPPPWSSHSCSVTGGIGCSPAFKQS